MTLFNKKSTWLSNRIAVKIGAITGLDMTGLEGAKKETLVALVEYLETLVALVEYHEAE